jgi:hypothetical protein
MSNADILNLIVYLYACSETIETTSKVSVDCGGTCDSFLKLGLIACEGCSGKV